MLNAIAANDRCSLDFVSDQLTDCRKFRILMVVDDRTRECLALIANTSLSGLRVACELNRIIEGRGKAIQNAVIESLNGRLRDELLNEAFFSSLTHARLTLSN